MGFKNSEGLNFCKLLMCMAVFAVCSMGCRPRYEISATQNGAFVLDTETSGLWLVTGNYRLYLGRASDVQTVGNMVEHKLVTVPYPGQ